MMTRSKSFFFTAVSFVALAFLASGCAHLDVKQVTKSNQDSVEGVRIYLPKPFLVATPQADGTVNFDFVFLPDKSQEYAIQPSEGLASYTFQVSRDEKELLTQVEYKADTTLVGQQLLASAGAGAAQTYNMQAAQSAAAQTQVNTAQAALDTANQAAQAAAAALASDQANQPTNYTLIANDQSALAQAQAKLPVAQAALQRAKTSGQAVATAATATTPIAGSGPTISSYIAQPTLNTPYTVNLPNKFGPLLYAINNKITGGKEEVTLTAVESEIKGTKVVPDAEFELNKGVNGKAQPTFQSINAKPTLSPSTQTVDGDPGTVSLTFSQPILDGGMSVKITADTSDHKEFPSESYKPELKQNNTVLKLTFKAKPDPGNYIVLVNYAYHEITGNNIQPITDPVTTKTEVNLTVQKTGVPVLAPASQKIAPKDTSISFSFSKPISKLGDIKVTPSKDPTKPVDATATLAGNNTVLGLAFKNPLASDDYTVDVNFSFTNNDGGKEIPAKQSVTFTVK
jgi:methionine-rich copper-binding protein CopC